MAKSAARKKTNPPVPPAPPAPPNVMEVRRYEGGQMSQKEMNEFFQRLIDSGHCWKLQGHYGRTAERLIASGACKMTQAPGRG